MSFATIGDMASRGRKPTFMESVNVTEPSYPHARPESLEPRWYDVRYWTKRKWVIVGVIVVLLLTIIIAVSVVMSQRNSRYPDYKQLNYALSHTYGGLDFFQNFNYFTGYDPTGGHVHYVPREQATQLNLTYATTSTALLKVDTSVKPDSVPNASTGRFSVRLTSKETYNVNTLFLFSVLHTPLGCATWPALWLTDPSNWPMNGEVDIMETVNPLPDKLDLRNQMTLHTSSGCTMAGVHRRQTGKTLSSSCLNTTNDNEGCAVSPDAGTYGSGWNNNGGGLLAVELRDDGIRMWQWAQATIPKGLEADGSGIIPDPSTWGEATADFPNTECDIGARFRNMSIVINISLCGYWAGREDVYSQHCPGDCAQYVANNPDDFVDAFWEFGGFSVYNVA